MASSLRVGFLGAGKMAAALARGLVEGRVLTSAAQIRASCPAPDAALLAPFADLGCGVTHDNRELARGSDLLMVSVKPNVVPFVLEEVKAEVGDGTKLVVSIAAGVRLEQLQDMLTPAARVSCCILISTL